MKKLFVILILAGLLLLIFGSDGKAQEDAAAAINQDIDISGAELGVSDPTILPTSPLYFLKNVSRFLQDALTFNPVKKAALFLKFANEKLLEAKKLTERQGISEETLKNALENYNREMERIREQLKTTTEKTLAVENFLDKLVDYGIKQQKILDKISSDFQSARETVEQIKEKSLETLTAVPLKLETADEFGQRLEKITIRQTGSVFKDFKNLEVLKEVEVKVPTTAKDAIRKVQEKTLNRLQQTLTNLTEAEKIKFENYAKEIPGSPVRQIQILNNLRQTAVADSIKGLIEKTQERAVERLEIRAQEKTREETINKEIQEEKVRQMLETANEAMIKLQKIIETNAVAADQFPAVFRLRDNARKHLEDARKALAEKKFGAAWGLANAALQNIQNALRILEIKPELILKPSKATTTMMIRQPMPGEFYCIQLWQPVCGADGKTYSNTCFAKIAGVRIIHEGECEKPETNPATPSPAPAAIPKIPRTKPTIINPVPPPESITCGGIAGKHCPTGYTCNLMGDYPDASGICVPNPTKPTPITE